MIERIIKYSFIRLIIYLIICGILLMFLNNIIGEKDKESTEKIVPTISELDVEKYNYELINKVKLLHSKTGTVEEIYLDEYIVNVLAAEMPVDFHIEALKAQAIVARTYTLYKITKDKKHEIADICDNSNCCQAWISKDDRFIKWGEIDNNEKITNWNKLVLAVNETKGKYITYNNEVINAFFHSNSSGKTAKAEEVWGGVLPYLAVVETSGEENYSSYLSEVKYKYDEFENKLKTSFENFKIDLEKIDSIKILEHTESGRVKLIKIGNMEFSGVEIRKLFNLKSTNFTVFKDGENIIFKVYGYGHGVGLSQTGSDALAKQGYNDIDIIKHFYKNIEIHE